MPFIFAALFIMATSPSHADSIVNLSPGEHVYVEPRKPLTVVCESTQQIQSCDLVREFRTGSYVYKVILRSKIWETYSTHQRATRELNRLRNNELCN